MQPFPSVVVRTQTSSSLFLMQIPNFSTRFFFHFKKKYLSSPLDKAARCIAGEGKFVILRR